jgi:hypothetical protein
VSPWALTLKVRNGDGQNTSTVELVICFSDLGDPGECDRLGFVQGVHEGILEDDELCRTITRGAIRHVVLRAICALPISDSFAPATELKGNLVLRDNRRKLLPPMPFVVDLEKKRN